VEPLILNNGPGLEDALEQAPDRAAVFLVHMGDPGARPYLGRTSRLRRRLKRLLGAKAGGARGLDLRRTAARAECYFAASPLAGTLLYYEFARRYFPEDYPKLTRLRPPPWVKVLLANEFPRTTISTQLSASRALHYGPFRTRAAAERFEQEVLDLFQVRRCPEDLAPSPDHPGCIYGEMARCCRPCQQVVGPEEYRGEVERLTAFLHSGGAHLLDSISALRERFSEQMEFEEAQRQHQRYQRVEQVLKLRDELVTDVDRLCGVAVLPSLEAGCVELRFVRRGVWLAPVEFRVAASGEMVPLDRRLRELAASLEEPRVTIRERQEHIALLSRWFYSSWRDGEWIGFPSWEEIPFRRLVRALSRAAAGSQASLFESGSS
jgi:excinuclease UvrABC nuclease subunit